MQAEPGRDSPPNDMRGKENRREGKEKDEATLAVHYCGTLHSDSGNTSSPVKTGLARGGCKRLPGLLLACWRRRRTCGANDQVHVNNYHSMSLSWDGTLGRTVRIAWRRLINAPRSSLSGLLDHSISALVVLDDHFLMAGWLAGCWLVEIDFLT